MSSPATTTTSTTHILVFPYPAQGHMLALLDLTHYLALNGLKITILVTPKNLPSISTLLSTHPNSIQPLVLPFPPHPKLPSNVEHIKHIGNSGNAPFIASLSKLDFKITQWFQSQLNPPHLILSDFFLGFTQNLALKLNIPRIAFFSTRAILNSVLTHLLNNIDGNLHTMELVEFPDIPTLNSLPKNHLPSIVMKYQKGDSDWEIVKGSLLANSKSWGFVINTFHALEGEILDDLKKKLGHDRVYGVGPLCLFGKNTPNPDFESTNYVLNWLDKCENDSVLYICFGSQKWLTISQLEALALGLEKSKIKFIWVIKSDENKVLEEFEKRVIGQGIVVRGYAPQVKILGHKAVGGFLSHCGWNSLIEGIVSGVLFLAWPMEADQYLNARLLVEDLKIGVRVCEGEDTVPNPDEIGQVMLDSMCGMLAQREKVKEISERASEAVKDGGSSSMDLDLLVKELKKIEKQKGDN